MRWDVVQAAAPHTHGGPSRMSPQAAAWHPDQTRKEALQLDVTRYLRDKSAVTQRVSDEAFCAEMRGVHEAFSVLRRGPRVIDIPDTPQSGTFGFSFAVSPGVVAQLEIRDYSEQSTVTEGEGEIRVGHGKLAVRWKKDDYGLRVTEKGLQMGHLSILIKWDAQGAAAAVPLTPH